MAKGRGTTAFGTQSAQDSVNYPAKHASGHELSTPIIHNPLPGAANNRPVSDGSKWVTQAGIALAELLGGARGDIIRREAAAYVTYVANTARQFLVGDGTDVISRAIQTADLPSAALTRANDTNVTLTLGGNPAAALLAAASLTLGWTGQLAPGRGGTGVNNPGTFTNPANSAITGGGTVALGGHVLTVPEPLIAAGRNVANTFTEANYFASWGESPFTADDLLLLGPGCPLDATSWTTLRGQAATLSGAFHPVNGRWPGTRALMVEGAGLNYELAPRMIDADSSGVADGWSYWDGFGSGGSATETVVVHPITERGWMQRLQYTAAPGDVNDTMTFYDVTANSSFAEDEPCTLSCDMYGSSSGVLVRIYFQVETDIGGALGGVFSDPVVLTSAVQRITVTLPSLPATAGRVRLYLYVTSVDDGDEFDVYFGAVNVEKLAYPTSFMSGDLPYCAWSGVADASTSTRAATEVNLDAYASLLSDNDTWSVSLWWQPQYDADADRSGQRDLFDVTSGAGANRCVIQYLDSDIYGVYINGDYRLTSAAQTFGAGDWQHVLLTSDFGTDEYFLYINGVEADSDTTALTASTGLVQMNLGTRFNNTEHSNAAHSQLAIFDSVLTAADAAAIYQAGNPLTDQGATQTPSLAGRTLVAGDANQAVINEAGALTFSGAGSGLPYGSLYLHEGAANVDISAAGQGVYVKITGFVTGHLNNVTINSDAFRVGVVGHYRIYWQISGDSAGNNKDYEIDIFINGVEQPDGSARREFGAIGSLGSLSSSCICDITNTAHDIDIRMKELGAGAGTDFDIFNMSFNIVMVGGT